MMPQNKPLKSVDDCSYGNGTQEDHARREQPNPPSPQTTAELTLLAVQPNHQYFLTRREKKRSRQQWNPLPGITPIRSDTGSMLIYGVTNRQYILPKSCRVLDESAAEVGERSTFFLDLSGMRSTCASNRVNVAALSRPRCDSRSPDGLPGMGISHRMRIPYSIP